MSMIKDTVKSIINMSGHIDHRGASASIRKNISFRGPNIYILACAIIIASVGLNVNSIPVIIGAMLVSPVMGPVLGFGFGLGTRDNRLVKDSLSNFAIMVGISIAVSTLYFVLSPLNLERPTELLARTNPTVYDVLIAFFGGFAGILEISRKDKGTVLPGVAIATALMPPLCTIGYGLSVMNWHFIIGALYLFLINSIFIALATFLAVKYLGFPAIADSDEKKTKMTEKAVAVILLAIIIPSVFSAVNIVKESNFRIHAANIVEANRSIGKGFIYDYKVDFMQKPPVVELYMAGETLSDQEKDRIVASAESYGITRPQIHFLEDAARSRSLVSDAEIVKNIYEHSDRQVRSLSDSLSVLKARIDSVNSKALPVKAVLNELVAQYPSVKSLVLTDGEKVDNTGKTQSRQIVAIIDFDGVLDNDAESRIRRWLQARLAEDDVVTYFNHSQ